MGQADVAYIHGGWQFSANTFWGVKDEQQRRSQPGLLQLRLGGRPRAGQGSVRRRGFRFDGHSTRSSGASEGSPVRGSAGLVGYDFGSFSGNFKLTQDVSEAGLWLQAHDRLG